MDGPTYNGSILRPAHVAASFVNTPDAGPAQVFGGALPSGGALKAGASSGMNVAVATGYALCPSSAGSTDGGYLFGLTTAATLTIAGADPSNPRIDLVCATANDIGSSASAGEIQVVTGTAAPSPVAPSLPGNSIALAQVAVGAGVTSIIAGNITDKRVFTAAIGGIVPVPDLSHVPSGYTGMFVYDRSTGRLAHNPASGPAQPKLLPFAPQNVVQTANKGAISGTVTICSATVTTDGNTDLVITARWPGLYINNGSAFGVYGAQLEIQIDGTAVAAVVAPAGTNASAGSNLGTGGGSIPHVTAGGTDRPSAGTHTVSFVLSVVAGDATHQVQMPCATSGSPAMLYVSAAPL
jgi:hypothetical protein